jgi:DNA gyrase subunit B
MPELIERGHVYIAQPPLYKLTSGKKETYVKDDEELHRMLLDLALEDAELVPKHDTDKPLSGTVLRGICSDYFVVETAIERMARRYQAEVLWALSGQPQFEISAFSQPSQRDAFAQVLSEVLNVDVKTGGAAYRVSWDDQTEGVALVVDSERHGRYRQSRFLKDFFESTEYTSLTALGHRLRSEVGEAITVKRGQREKKWRPLQRRCHG